VKAIYCHWPVTKQESG